MRRWLFLLFLLGFLAQLTPDLLLGASSRDFPLAKAPTLPNLSSKETIVFFPALARQDGNFWDVEVRGWIFKQEHRPAAIALLRKYLGVQTSDLTKAEQKYFADRTKLFQIEAKRGQKISIQLGDKTY